MTPAAPRLHGLPPLIDAQTRVLVLGSFPSAASLAAGQYYAHPQNLFWRLLGEILGQPLRELDYASRCAAVQAAGIGIWDIYARCRREGSLDSAIREAVPNDFAFLAKSTPAGRGASYELPESLKGQALHRPPGDAASRRSLPPDGRDGSPPVAGAGIVRVCFNGRTAARPRQAIAALGVAVVELPSTSPANAGIPYAEKLARWRAGLTLTDDVGPVSV